MCYINYSGKYVGFGLRIRGGTKRATIAADVFNIRKKNTRQQCSPESRRSSGGSHKEVRSRWAEDPPDSLSGLLLLECSTDTTKQGPRARPHTETQRAFDRKYKGQISFSATKWRPSTHGSQPVRSSKSSFPRSKIFPWGVKASADDGAQAGSTYRVSLSSEGSPLKFHN